MVDLSKVYKGGRKKGDGRLGKYMAKKKEADERKAAEAKLPPEALCAYCGEMKRAYRDIGGKEDIARICADCEKNVVDTVLGEPQYEDEAPQPPAEERAEGVEEDDPSEGDGRKPRRRKSAKPKRGVKNQKVRR